jgi:uncharacterized repeat protein (TIGR01451 family)
MELSRRHGWRSAVAGPQGLAAASLRLLHIAAGLGLRAFGAQSKAWAGLVLALCAFAAGAAAPNTTIVNTATASYKVSGTPLTTSGSATVTTAAGTPATIALMATVASTQGLPPGLAVSTMVAGAQCHASSGAWVPVSATVPGQGAFAVPANHLLVPATTYAAGDVVLVQVTAPDENRDPTTRETVTVTVTSDGGDSEQLRLTETGVSTGVFVGYIQTSNAAAQSGDCVLQTGGKQTITATYVDASASNSVITAGALIDPFGKVFDSSSGLPVSGASVTVINAATGLPAAVLGNDGVSTFPSTVVTGSTVTDSGGTSYTFAAGRYQFPRLAPGSYRFQVALPAGYTFPSTAADATIAGLANGPFTMVQGSRGETFTLVPGPALEMDIPVDPGAIGSLNITKTAGKATAGIGDFVPYALTITSRNSYVLTDVSIADRLPVGFRYRAGTARLDGKVLPDPQVGADGRSLQFAIGTLAANATVTLRYAVQVTAGAHLGDAENTAQATGRITSNVAKAVVSVRDDLNRTRAILMGRVMVAESCAQNEREPGAVQGLPGVRVLLQDGTTVVTDAEGNWHIDNLRPGTHVVQIDTTTLPPGTELRNCDQNSRTGGRDFSQFVNVQGGTLWRADFRLVRTATCVQQALTRRGGEVELALGSQAALQGVTATVMLPDGAKVKAGSVTVDGRPPEDAQVQDGFVVLRLPAQSARWQHALRFTLDGSPAGELKAMLRVQAAPGHPLVTLQPLALPAGQDHIEACAAMPLTRTEAPATAAKPAASASAPAASEPALDALVEKLPYDERWLATAPVGNEWLHPRATFSPAIPVVKVAVKHVRGSRAELKVNGVPVDRMRFEGSTPSASGDVLLSNWRAVDLRDGANVLQVTVRDAEGKVLMDESRTIHYAVAPATVSLDAKRSKLVADGLTMPVIAVRMLDRDGKPVRRGVSGDVNVAPPYLPRQFVDALQQDPLTATPTTRGHYVVGEDGIALVTLQPTQKSGEAVLRFDFGDNRQNEVRAWLQADVREWILVGFAEGTAGHKNLSGNMQSLQDSEAGEQLFDRDRLAFYAKGKVLGEYLLTAAYDSAKEKGTGADRVLKQSIDPTQYYTLYADANQAQYDAASTSKLYLRIEKKQFYALFGDYDTGLTVTELGRYSRTMTGLKSGYQGETYSYNAFAARTSQGFGKDELQGDGTSGLYHLRARGILMNSEKVRIETRDRFQPDRVLSTRTLTAYIDYQLDRDAGTLFFREPVPSRDQDLNLLFIVVEYETDDAGQAGWTYGGRAAAKVAPNAEVGVTRLHEGTPGRDGNLTAADTTVQVNPATKVRAEVATSRSNTATGEQSGQAYLVEATHDDGQTSARAYAREQEPGFGLGQQTAAAVGQRKVGADARQKITDKLSVGGEAYRQEDLGAGGKRDVVEAKAQWTDKEAGVTVTGGGRVANETTAAGQTSDARQVTGGVAYETMEGRLVLRAATDLGVAGSTGTTNFPNRVALGADYRLTPETTTFVTQEFARGDLVRANTTRVGLRTQLWTGAEAHAGMGSQEALDAGRLFSDMGLVQKIKLGEHWNADLGIDRVQTLRSTANPLGAAQPLASGTTATSSYGLITEDFTAVSTGLAYNDGLWGANTRLEWRDSASENKINLLAGAQRKLAQGRIVAAGLQVTDSHGTDTVARQVALRLGQAWRPNDSEWAWLQRIEYVEDRNVSLATQLWTRKLIANFNGNWKASPRTQVALQYSAKYVREMLGETTQDGYTDLWGIEARHDLDERWDIGLHGGVLTTWRTGTRSYQAGLSLGYRVATNTWVSVGYNFLGFSDSDFAGSEYRAQGFFVNMRVKFDQDTLNLNDRKAVPLDLKP